MATYQYECEFDGVFDYEHAIGQNPPKEICKVCKGEAKRVWNATRTIFRGTGWGGQK